MNLLNKLFRRTIYFKIFSSQTVEMKINEDYIHWHKRALDNCLRLARKSLCVKPMKEEAYLFVRFSIQKYLEAAVHAANLQKSELVDKILLELSSHRNFYESTIAYDGFDDEECKEWFVWFETYFTDLKQYKSLKYVEFLKKMESHIDHPSYSAPIHSPEKPVQGKNEMPCCFYFRYHKYRRDMEIWNKLIDEPIPQIPVQKENESNMDFHNRKMEFVAHFVVWAEAQKDKDMSQVDRLQGVLCPSVPVKDYKESNLDFFPRIVKYIKEKKEYDRNTLKPLFPIKLPWEKEDYLEKKKEIYKKALEEYFRKGGKLIKPSRKNGESETAYNRRLDIYMKELAIYEPISKEIKAANNNKEWEKNVSAYSRRIRESKYIDPLKKRQIIENYKINSIEVKELNLNAHGRLKGSFGKYGYCLTNPVCVKKFMPIGISNYLGSITYKDKKVKRYECIAIYEVSIFGSSRIKEYNVEFDGISDKIILYFAENENLVNIDTPKNIYKYYGHQEKSYCEDDIRFSLRIDEKSHYERLALIKYEESITVPYTFKIIWRKQ